MANINANIISFKKGFFFSSESIPHSSENIVCTINAELMSFGYILSPEVFEAMMVLDPETLTTWSKDVISYLKDIMGDGDYVPLHKGFPDTVLKMPAWEIYRDQLMHYWSGGTWAPEEEYIKHYIYEHKDFKEIVLGDTKSLGAVFTDLVSVNGALTPADRAIIAWFLMEYSPHTLNSIMPKEVPFKETLAMLASKGLTVPVKTSTDVLRIAAYMSHGSTDISLPPKFIKSYMFSKPELNPERIARRWDLDEAQKIHIMHLLESVANPREMILKRRMWVTLAHHIRSQEYTGKASEALQIMRQKNGYPKSWYGRVDAFKHKPYMYIKTLAERPGEFARRLDYMIREDHFPTKDVLLKFKEIGGRVSNKVLFELWAHFEGRLETQTERKILVKRKPVKLPLLPALAKDVVEEVLETIWEILYFKFEQLPSLGETWIDPELKSIPLPTNMKSLSESLDVRIRGQRAPFTNDTNVLRLYCHWKGRHDIDLSALILTGNRVEKVGYGGKADHDGIYYSGDNTGRNAQNAEYIDITNTSADYVLLMLNLYRGPSFKKLETRVGWQSRSLILDTVNWVPKHVTNSFKIEEQSSSVAVAIFDLKAKEWILIDEAAKNVRVANAAQIKGYVKSLAEEPRVSVYDLLYAHADARGTRVDEITENTETIFEYKDFCSSYEKTLKFML